MDAYLPPDLVDGPETAPARRRRRSRLHLVVVDGRRHDILRLSARGFIIAAEEPPHLRGYVDIFRGSERIGRHLVVFAWAARGMAGYEFKHESIAREVTPDHVAATRPARLPRPGS